MTKAETIVQIIKDTGIQRDKLRNETTGRDIRRNCEVIVPAHYIPFFNPYTDFINQVRDNYQSL